MAAGTLSAADLEVGVLPRTGPSTPSTTLADNRRLVLEVLRTGGELTRNEIGEASGLSPAATARITDRLEAERLIAKTGQAPSGGGRPAWRYRFTAEGRYLVGLRVQGDGCRGAVVGWDEQVVARSELLLEPDTATPDAILDATLRCARNTVRECAWLGRPPVALGVAVPAVTEADGHVRAGTEVGWDELPLGELLIAATDRPVRIENDANVLAYSELTPGGHTASLAALILGHGLGAGIISEGHLLRGAHSTAGEIGYLLTSRSVLSRGRTEIGDLELRIQRAARADPARAAAAPARLWSMMGRPTASEAVSEMLDYLA
ncbi:MAG: ROK family protein, partial [Gammaproteobacteria bacterium]|nr:ROK family protein [Gammaproteobacteria bacterium]